MNEEFADCGLDGDANEPVKVGPFNSLIRLFCRYRLAPVEKIAKTMQAHVEECALKQAKIYIIVRMVGYLMALCATVGTALLITLLTHRFGL